MGLSVLMISPQFRPLVGGYERAAERLCGALARAGVRVLVLTEREDPAWEARERLDGYELRRLWCGYRRLPHAPIALASFALFLLRRGREFDVWHVHQCGPHAALAVALGKLLRRPVVIKLASSGAIGIRRLDGRRCGRALAFLHRKAAACLAVSEETRAEALGFGVSPERVRLIPNGADGRRFRPATGQGRAAARRALGLDGRTVLLSVGRLSSEKNPLGLLEAWGAVGAKVRQQSLLALVGDGAERERVREAASRLGLRGTVHLAGACADVETWYRAADICVIASAVEGLSNSMLEALASGVPVVSTSVSGSQVLLEPPGAGLVAPVGDAARLAQAIEALLLDPPARRRLGANARRVFESRFSLDTVSRQMISLYQKLHRGVLGLLIVTSAALQSAAQALGDYRLSPGDLVDVSVYQDQELNRRVRVDSDGTVSMPLIGTVRVGGETVPQAELAIERGLAAYLINPQVSILVEDYGNKLLFVLGEVQRPGPYPILVGSKMTVLQAISAAGGFTKGAAPGRTRLLRDVGGKSVDYKVDLRPAIRRGDRGGDMAVEPNDVVYVPQSLF